MCLRVLLLVGPWRYCWACEDLAVLRPYYPEMDVEHDGLLPLPMCLNKLPTRIPFVVVPLVHLALWFTDLLMIPLYFEKRPGSVGPWRVIRPLLTSSRSVLDDSLQVRPWEAAKALARSHVESILQRTKAPDAVKYLLLGYYLLLCGFYFNLVFIAWLWVMVFAIVKFVSFVGVLRTIFGVFLVIFMVSDAFPIALVKGFSRFVMKRRAPPSGMAEIRAYHGTTIENADSIRLEGFRPSGAGMLGRGVYVSRDINKVLAYGGHNGVILELRVVLGRVCIVDRQGHENQHQWHGSHDTAWVPARCGMVGSGLEEGCIANPECVKLVRVWQKRHSHITALMFCELVRLALDACIRLAYCMHLSKVPKGGDCQPELKQPKPQPDLELMMPTAPPRHHTTCLDMERFTHTTVPPPLVHKIKRG